MRISQARELSLQSLLALFHFEAKIVREGQVWYLSPFRDEHTPSFKVNPSLNAWYDFGIGKGGDVIDFVMEYRRLSSVSEALQYLSTLDLSPDVRQVEPRPKITHSSTSELRLKQVGPIRSKALIGYLKNREIPLSLAAGFVKEVHYESGDRRYFGLALKNDSGGYEVRNKYWKGTIGNKDISTFEGAHDRVAVFEGMFDYLAAIAMNGGPLEEKVVVLNSVSLADRAIERIRGWNSKTADLYRDNDRAGKALLERFMSELPDVEVVDRASTYPNHDDLNAWFVDQAPQRSP